MAPQTKQSAFIKRKRAAPPGGSEPEKNKRAKQTNPQPDITSVSATSAFNHPFLLPPSVIYIDTWLHKISDSQQTMPKTSKITKTRGKKQALEMENSGDLRTTKRARKPTLRALEALESIPRPATPPLSAVELSSAGQKSVLPSEEEDSKKTKSSGRARNPAYRGEQEYHGVQIYLLSRRIPRDLRELAEGVLRRARGSPGPSQKELALFEDNIETWFDDDVNEASLQFQMLTETPCFPRANSYRTENGKPAAIFSLDVLFRRTAVPCSSQDVIPLALPKPDVLSGYTFHALADLGSRPVSDLTDVIPSGLTDYAAPAHAQNFWPYLITEFKTNRLGSVYVGETQNATAGACCVTGVEQLLKTAYPEIQRRVTDSMAFSCVLNITSAYLSVHWFRNDYVDGDGGPGPYSSAELEAYNLKKGKDVIAFRAALRNIMDWGLGDRLTTIREALLKVVASTK